MQKLNGNALAALLFGVAAALFAAPWLAGYQDQPEPFVSTIVLAAVLLIFATAAAIGATGVAASGAMTIAAWSLIVPVILNLWGQPAFWIHIGGGIAIMLCAIAGSVIAGRQEAKRLGRQGAGPAPGWLILRGALAIALGILAILFPASALFAFTLVFAAFALVDGAFSIASVAGEREPNSTPWWAAVLRGLVGILAGIVFLIMPLVATLGYALAALGLLSVWSILTGGFEIATAIRLRREIEGEWLLAVSGALSIVLGLAIPVALYFFPGITILSVAWMLGVYALAAGIVLVVQGARLAGFRRAAPNATRTEAVPAGGHA